MDFLFRRAIRVIPGLWLNLPKSGVSTSISRGDPARDAETDWDRYLQVATVAVAGVGILAMGLAIILSR